MKKFRSFMSWRAAERRLGSIADQRYGFGDAGPLETLLRDAGFHDVRSRIVSCTIRFEDGASFVRMNSMALIGMSAGAKALHNEERKRVLETLARESEPVLQSYSDGSGLAFELSTNLARARAYL
jgi:hypothetical protein